jgi:hypothetical protein
MSEYSAMIKFPPKPVSKFARNTDAPGEIPSVANRYFVYEPGALRIGAARLTC